MNAAGYESILCGKMHYDKTRRYGFTEIGNMNTSQKKGKGSRRKADDLEPKPRGRPARHVTAHEERSTELAAEIVTLERELAAQTVRLELAQTLPQVVRPTPSGPEKKRNRALNRRKKHRR